jgi:hypothetical protein
VIPAMKTAPFIIFDTVIAIKTKRQPARLFYIKPCSLSGR